MWVREWFHRWPLAGLVRGWFRPRVMHRLLGVESVDGRRFKVTVEHESQGGLTAYVHPATRQREQETVTFGGSDVRFPTDTSLRFKLLKPAEKHRGLVTNIQVISSRRRQGWATSMIGVLLLRYPEYRWTVEAPNEQSGQLFVRLSEQHPGVVFPPAEDTRLHVSDQRRYSTRQSW